MALRSRATQARAARAAQTEEAEEQPKAGSLAERRRRAVQPRGGTAEPAPAPAPDEAPAPTNAPDEEPQDDPAPAEDTPVEEQSEAPDAPAKKAARKPRSDKGIKRTTTPVATDGMSAADIRTRMREVEAQHKELVKVFEADKKALTDVYAQLAVQLLEAQAPGGS